MTEQEIKPCKFVNGACIHCEAIEQGDCEGYVCDDSLYASYTKRPWVGLTEEDKQTAVWTNGTFGGGALWAEAMLKERNG